LKKLNIEHSKEEEKFNKRQSQIKALWKSVDTKRREGGRPGHEIMKDVSKVKKEMYLLFKGIKCVPELDKKEKFFGKKRVSKNGIGRSLGYLKIGTKKLTADEEEVKGVRLPSYLRSGNMGRFSKKQIKKLLSKII